MILLSALDFSLPLKNPVIIFSLVLFIILFMPLLLNRLRIPHIIGLILAGIVIGPYGLNLLLRDSSIVLFGTVGLLYIMFTAGLEIDLEEFRKNRLTSFVFGLFTFIVPMITGSLAAYYIIGFSAPSAILLASLLSSHTLLAYPIASKYGVARIRSVTMAIGGTIVTDILALLVLATIIGITQGNIGSAFWIRLAISSVIFGAIVFFVFPLIARWFFKHFSDSVSQYIFVLAMVFLGSFLAEAAGLEAIIGAFLSGLALNRFIPHTSALMNRIEFVGNAIFIPFFLIGVGMLIDFRVLFKGIGALEVAAVMIIIALLSKFISAWLTQRTFRLSNVERQMIFGLSSARVGATLAIVLVGYNIILGESSTGEPIRLLNEDVLNGAILMILVTCTISSLTVEKASRKLAMAEGSKTNLDKNGNTYKVLVSLAYPDTVNELVDVAFTLLPPKVDIPVYALHVISDERNNADATEEKKMLDNAIRRAASSDNVITPLSRFDLNISNGIIYTIKEYRVTDVIIGLHRHNGASFLGNVVEEVVQKSFVNIYVYKAVQPINTIKRLVVVMPANAQYEKGFAHWFNKVYTIARETGHPLVIYGDKEGISELTRLNEAKEASLEIAFSEFSNWEEFLIFSREIKENDLFIIISSRKGYLSYLPMTERVHDYLSRHFSGNSIMIIYPEQHEGEGGRVPSDHFDL